VNPCVKFPYARLTVFSFAQGCHCRHSGCVIGFGTIMDCTVSIETTASPRIKIAFDRIGK